jgi:uncharacterized protein
MDVRRERRGRFLWHDLMSPNVRQSLEFYQSLFPEWEVQDIDMGDAGSYHVICVDGRKCGGVVPVDPAAKVASHWLGYVDVAECRAAVDRAIAEGGTVPVPLMDVPNVGKFAVVADRQQAMIKALEPVSPGDFPDEPASGQFCWNELLTSDVASARSFYQSVFGWSAIEQFSEGKGEYTLMRSGEQDVAGIMPLSSDVDHAPAWLTYVYAEDLDERFARAEALGAQVVIPPRDIPGACRFAVVTDPVGAAFAMMRLPAGETGP